MSSPFTSTTDAAFARGRSWGDLSFQSARAAEDLGRYKRSNVVYHMTSYNSYNFNEYAQPHTFTCAYFDDHGTLKMFTLSAYLFKYVLSEH